MTHPNTQFITIIPSKDRAPQLRLLLESIFKNLDLCITPIYIIYDSSNDAFEEGYRKLMAENIHPNIYFIKQNNPMGLTIYRLLSSTNAQYVCFFVDDCIVYRRAKDITFKQVSLAFVEDNDTWCYSMRLGMNTTLQNHKTNHIIKAPQPLLQADKYFKYSYKHHNPEDNFGYYWSWDGCIYNKNVLLNHVVFDEFKNLDKPRPIETYMFHRKRPYRYLMACPYQSAVVCMEWNCVQDTTGYYGGVVCAMAEDLNKLYIELDQVIDLESLNVTNIRSCHYELPFATKIRTDLTYEFYQPDVTNIKSTEYNFSEMSN